MAKQQINIDDLFEAETVSFESVSDPAPAVAQPARRVPRPVKWALFGAGVVLAFACGSRHPDAASVRDAAAQNSQPKPTVTVTVRETVMSYPSSCTLAMQHLLKYQQAAAKIGSAGGPQVDIATDAYVAILQKDAAKLNVVADKQRRLQSSIAAANAELLPLLAQIKRETEQCTSDLQN